MEDDVEGDNPDVRSKDKRVVVKDGDGDVAQYGGYDEVHADEEYNNDVIYDECKPMLMEECLGKI